jgi:hypothetical protein
MTVVTGSSGVQGTDGDNRLHTQGGVEGHGQRLMRAHGPQDSTLPNMLTTFWDRHRPLYTRDALDVVED